VSQVVLLLPLIRRILNTLFWFFWSHLGWLIQGIKNKDKALVILNTVFMTIDLIGTYRWIL